ncbi:MAG: hypothetical protein LBU35_02330, partial [Holosporales bacterium]|nr:hypothetical protein [Holosporales bacterium]
ILSHKYFKLNPIDDIIGVQICGAIKNIIAIACGISSGLGIGQNTQSAILTFGLKEMKKLGERLGAKEKTFYGLCGLGDLVLTASSDLSRNRILGKRIANGEKVSVICDTKRSACEGYDTLRQVIELSKLNEIEMPICQAVFNILFTDADPKSILNAF